MFKFWKKKEYKTPVNFTSLVKEGANFVIVFSEDTFLTYEILQYCYNWDDKFKEFNFFLPEYSCSFFRKTNCFSNAKFHEISSNMTLFEDSIILNLNSDPAIRKKLVNYSQSLIIDGANEGNLQFVPSIRKARDLFQRFTEFFDLSQQKRALTFNFTEEDFGKAGRVLFQNKFLNFLIDTYDTDIETLRKIIISIKQNFPSNIYLNGQILKKHEFINLMNMENMTLLDKFLFSGNSDLLISDDLETVRIFRDLDVTQLCITDDQHPQNVTCINSRNLHVIKDAIAAVLENT